MNIVKNYFRVFIRSWSCGDASARDISLYRWLLLLLMWPVFISLQCINGLGLLLDRLLFAGFLRTQVNAPVFIIGLPRSGTTYFHRLLASDADRYTTMKLWELLFAPSITQRYCWFALAWIDQQIGSPVYKLISRVEKKLSSSIEDIHPTGLFEAEEDYLALLPILACFILILPLPQQQFWKQSRFDLKMTEQQKREVLDFYEGIIKRHLYFYSCHEGKEKTYLSKNPSFTPMINSLAQRFNDAHFVICVRNPTSVVPSQVNSMIVGAKMFDTHANEHYWRDNLTGLMRFYYTHIMHFLHNNTASHFVVPMEWSTQQPYDCVASLYQSFGWRMDEHYQKLLADKQQSAERYESKHQYSLDALGMEERTLRKQFVEAYQYFNYPMPGN